MTKISVSCPDCGAEREVDDRLAGGTVSCATCGASLRIPLPGLGEGADLGNFILIRQLGAGAMGEVWLARQKSMDRLVALKVLARDLTFHPDFITRFRKEVKISAKLEHPNIVTAFDAGCEDDTHFLAISYVDGETLSDRLAQQGPLAEKEALRIARDIARALRYAWGQFSLLHRDIKPSNIMVDREGTVKLMDMGISKSTIDDAQLTMTGSIIGTPYYMSPEQAIGDKTLDSRSDIYSLGATLYHLVTGTVPYDSTTTMGIVSKHLTEPFPPPQERNSAVSEPCAVLLEVMMAKQRDQRQAGWEEVIRDIDLVLAERFPVTVRPAVGASLVTRPLSPQSVLPTVLLPGEKTGPPRPATAVPGAAATGVPAPAAVGGRGHAAKYAMVAALVVVVVVLAVVLIGLMTGKPPVPPPRIEGPLAGLADALPEDPSPTRPPGDRAAVPPITPTTPTATTAADPHAATWQAAVDFSHAHPDAFDPAIRNFTEIGRTLAGTKYQLLADMEVRRLEAEREQAVNEVMAALDQEAEARVAKEQIARGAEVFVGYDGRLREETAALRHERAEHWRQRASQAEATRKRETAAAQAEQDRRDRLRRVGEDVLGGRLKQVLAGLDGKNAESELGEMLPLLRELAEAPKAVIESFRRDIGKSVTLATVDGEISVTILRVIGPVLLAELQIGKAAVRKRIPLGSLSQEEIFRRSGLHGDAGAIFQAIQAVKEGRFAEARTLLAGCSPGLREPLLTALVGIDGEDKTFAGTDTKAPEPMRHVDEKPPAKPPTSIPGDPAALQEALRKANPGYDGGGRIMTDPDGMIVEVQLGQCPGIRDLSPLAGLSLRFLDLSGTDVADLSPLARLPLHGINLDRCRRVTDLAPLATLRSLRYINAHATGIVDINPLRGMMLNSLNLDGTKVADLEPLRGMPLRELRLEQCPVDDYSVLAGLTSLEQLYPADLWRKIPGKADNATRPPPPHRRQPPGKRDPR